MLSIPIPFLGIKGMRMFAKKVVEWPKFARDTEHLSHEIMKINILLEDQGTGGAGFRFIYGAFLNEAADVLKMEWLRDVSFEMGETANKWREFSYLGSRNCKKRGKPEQSYDFLADILLEIAEMENKIFNKLIKIR